MAVSTSIRIVGDGFGVPPTAGGPGAIGDGELPQAAPNARTPISRTRRTDRSYSAERVCCLKSSVAVTVELVAVRVPEIGVRMTLGARPSDILRQLLAEGFRQTAIGLVIGLAAGAYLMKFAQTLLYAIKPWDPNTLTGVSLVLIAAALAACLVPARRAMKVDPVEALRQS